MQLRLGLGLELNNVSLLNTWRYLFTPSQSFNLIIRKKNNNKKQETIILQDDHFYKPTSGSWFAELAKRLFKQSVYKMKGAPGGGARGGGW